MTTTRIVFESEACARCGGSGNIPAYGNVYGGVCFGCNGSGNKLTRAGKAARKRYDDLMDAASPRVPAYDVAIGDLFWSVGSRKFVACKAKDFSSRSGVLINGQCLGSAVLTSSSIEYHFTPDTLVKLNPSTEARREILAKVLKLKGATEVRVEVAA